MKNAVKSVVRRFPIRVVASCAVVLAVRYCCAQETIQFSVRANGLAGDVYCCDAVGVDGKLIDPGQPVADVEMSECDAMFQRCVELGKSDKDGKFRFVSTKGKRMLYLKLVRAGFNQDHVMVTFDRKGRELHLKLGVAA
jgi:hypothetical protein